MAEEIVFIDRDFKISHANSEFCKYHNLSKEEVIGSYCYNVIHKLDEPCSLQDNVCPLKHVIKTKKSYRSLHKHSRRGKIILKDQFSTPYQTKNGEILSICILSKNTGTFHDNRKSKETLEKGHGFEDLPQLDKEVLVKQQIKELIQDIQIVTELCLFFLKKPLNKDDLVALWKEVYLQTQFGLDLLSDR
jgi:transcriptional regulator with PAS, ATPase and Fis domain